MIITRPLLTNEADLLVGNECEQLRFTSDDGAILICIDAPRTGWRHDQIETIPPPPSPWDAWLGKTWIGSSEV